MACRWLDLGNGQHAILCGLPAPGFTEALMDWMWERLTPEEKLRALTAVVPPAV